MVIRHAGTADCDAFCQRANVDFTNVLAEGNSQQFAIAGTTHMTFGDLGLMWGVLNPSRLGSIDATRMTLITRDAVRAFLDVNVRDVSPTSLEATIDRYPEIRR